MINSDKIFSIIDKTFENKGRKNIIGTIVTGIGSTIAAVGLSVLCTKSQDDSTQQIEETEQEDN